jgi:hypothetical protein
MDDQSIYMSYAVPQNLARKPGEYMTSGRFFASLVIHEGEKMAKMVTDFLGDNVLMYSSDYPHAESRFPESTSKVLAWQSLGDDVMRKMLWDTRSDASESPSPHFSPRNQGRRLRASERSREPAARIVRRRQRGFQ